jgi:hypothetical protein
VWALLAIRDEIGHGFGWHRDWLRHEKSFKSKEYRLQTDLEFEKRNVAILKIENDMLKNKFNLKK